jgi:hypothetical protein
MVKQYNHSWFHYPYIKRKNGKAKWLLPIPLYAHVP